MRKIVATNVVASRPPERRPTATPTARANNDENSGPLTSLPVDRLMATDINADRLQPQPLSPILVIQGIVGIVGKQGK